MKRITALGLALFVLVGGAPPQQIDLFITKLKVQNTIFFTLHHSGITTDDMDIYRNGEYWQTVGAGVAYGSITVMGQHKLVFRVCEPGTAICSPDVPLSSNE